MWAQNILLAVIGLSAGVIVASGLFSFVIELGVVSGFCRPHPHRRTHFALRGQCGAGRNTGEYFLGVPHIHTRWEYIGSSVRDSWWNICGMLGDGTCRNVECISNLHPAYEDHKKRTISHTWNRSRKDCGCAFVFCKSLGTVIMPRHS